MDKRIKYPATSDEIGRKKLVKSPGTSANSVVAFKAQDISDRSASFLYFYASIDPIMHAMTQEPTT